MINMHNVLTYSQGLAVFVRLRPPPPCSSWSPQCRILVLPGQTSWPGNCCTRANSTIVTVLSVHATEQKARQNKAMHLGLPLGLTYLPLLANSMDFTAVADDQVNLNDFKIWKNVQLIIVTPRVKHVRMIILHPFVNQTVCLTDWLTDELNQL